MKELGMSLALKSGDAKTGRDRRRLVSKAENERRELLAQTIHGGHNGVPIHVRQHHHKLFSAHASTNVRSARSPAKHFREFLENRVSCIVAITVVHILERIEVGQNDPQRVPMPRRAANLPLRPFFNCAAVWQAGQRIRTSRFLQQQVFRFDVTLQANDSPSHSYARAELARIEWLRKIVVGAGGQSLDHHVFVRNRSQQNDVRIGKFAFANSLAQIEAGHVRHHPIRNDDVVSILRENLERFTSAPGKSHTIIFIFQSFFNEFAVDGRIVSDQHGERRARLAHAAREARNPLWGSYRQGEQGSLWTTSLSGESRNQNAARYRKPKK